MTIRTRIIASFVCLFLIPLAMFAATFYSTSQQEHDGLVINLAGRQRMLSQKIAKEALLLATAMAAGKDVSEEKVGLDGTVQVFESTLKALANSGFAPKTLNPTGPQVQLPYPSEAVRDQLLFVEKKWVVTKALMRDVLQPDGHNLAKEFSASSVVVLKEMNKGVGMLQVEAEAKVSDLLALQTGCLVFGVLLMIPIIVNVQRNIAKPLAGLVEYTEAVAAGNHDAKMTVKCIEEMQLLKKGMQEMVLELGETIALAEQKGNEAADKTFQVEEALLAAEEARNAAEAARAEGQRQTAQDLSAVIERLSQASEELSAQLEQASRGADIQKARADESATAMEEMNSIVLEVARSAGMAAEMGENSKVMAGEGAKVVVQAMERIGSIKTMSEELKSNMDELGSQAENIGVVMNVIADIADQTNLWALNAAGGAARAGEAGKGFAVVADEVRKLAEKTTTATNDVTKAILAIQDSARKSIEGTEQTALAIEESNELARTSSEHLQEIVGGIEKTSEQVRSIAAAAEEQSTASEEITRATEEINQIARESADGLSQSSQAVGTLAEMAVYLRATVEQMTNGR